MPYVKRDQNNSIIGIFGKKQDDAQEEMLLFNC